VSLVAGPGELNLAVVGNLATLRLSPHYLFGSPSKHMPLDAVPPTDPRRSRDPY
jgi:hypothetical protein